MVALIRLLALVAAVSSTATVLAESWTEAKPAIGEAVNERDCEQVWELTWPWAKAGESEARWGLATGVVTMGLMPPGVGRDAITRFRHVMVMSVHGAAAGQPSSTELLATVLPTDLQPVMGRQLLRCLTDGKQPAQDCVDAAVAEGLVPSFAAYAAELDWLAAAAPDADATCEVKLQAEKDRTNWERIGDRP